MIVRICLVLAAIWLGGAGSLRAVLAQALVIDGEEIASAELFAAASREGRVIHYGTYPETSYQSIAAAFTKDTGVRLDYLRLTTQNMFTRVMTEHAAGKLEADVVDLTDLPLLDEWIAAGVFGAPYFTPDFSRIPKPLRDDNGLWYAFLSPPSAIMVNTAVVKESDFPKSYLDMLAPKWSGRISLPSIDAGGSAFSQYMFLRDVVAPDYWTRLAALKPRVHPASAPATMDLVRGDAGALMAGAETAIRQAEQGAPLKVIFPVEGLSAFPAAGGITSNAKNVNAAKLLVNWLLSRRGAKFIAATGAYPSHPDGPPAETADVKFPPASQVWSIPIGEWVAKRERYNQEWRDLFAGGR